ncbi:multidrug ABC transporter ATP-binding protein [Petrotoga sp. 9T1HF07.CasAA.8.2]|uniref:ABC transporter ATP-binding protein n=1 Tax=unclassified Petrotoga TaxID=2620614 RepID=UPI000CC6730B|nr:MULTISPECIES: ABC transporter ATP-binding protein [unclassified Petrotoga]MBL5981375.1 multidrug ABC transporter ATPase [Petrotoga sp. 8T1HF07.NaAc.6.1]PNR90017.1 multidrug ABC transporter ATP-binding protein [Petrotoga sp. 9T1HF07.CasAA.8.2]
MRTILSKYLKQYYKEVILTLVLLTVQAVSNLYLPNLNADIINNGVAKGDLNYIMQAGGKMLLFSLLLVGAAVGATFFASRISAKFAQDLRRDLYYKVMSFSQNDIDKFGTASLITRNTNDVYQIQMLVLIMLNVMILAPIISIGGAIMAIRQDVVLSTSLLVIIPVMGMVVFFLMRKAIPLFRSMQVKLDNVNRVLREKLMGVRVIRAFVKEKSEEKRFDKVNDDLTQTSIKVNRLLALGMPLLMLIMNLSTVSILWFGSMRIDSGAMPIGNLTAFLTYIMEILISIMMAMMMFVMWPRAEASADRIKEVLETEPTINEPDNPVLLKSKEGTVSFKNVTFKYEGAEKPVLRNISFEAKPGKTTAIVGSTGSGKSTLINLIPRFYEVTDGKIEIDGVDIRELSMENLRDSLGFVPQKAYLFSGTIASNLAYGKKDATEEEMWHALEIAQAKDFVEELPDKLQAPVDQGGTNFSGGQRQRLSIARAIVKKPKIYIFDDSFSALDNRTDANLREALKEETKNSTVIIVAQRVSTILNADLIIVLNDDGTIEGQGKHSELMQSCEVYRELVKSQLPEEETA